MPHKAVSAFNYGTQRQGSSGYELGSIWAQTLPGGCTYEQFYSAIPYGGMWPMPLNYLNRIENMEFVAIGAAKDRPVGAQMRP